MILGREIYMNIDTTNGDKNTWKTNEYNKTKIKKSLKHKITAYKTSKKNNKI